MGLHSFSRCRLASHHHLVAHARFPIIRGKSGLASFQQCCHSRPGHHSAIFCPRLADRKKMAKRICRRCLRHSSATRGIGGLDRRAQRRSQRFILRPHPAGVVLLCTQEISDALSSRGSCGHAWNAVQTDAGDDSVRAFVDRLLDRFRKEKIIWLLLEKIPFTLVAAVSAVATVLAQHGQIDTFGFSLPLRFENAIVSYAIYLRQLIWPVDLAVLYPYPEKFFPFLTIAGCAALLISLSAIAFIYRKRFPFLFSGWFWFIGMLVPVIGIVQVGRQAHADRYTYLPLIGITIAIVWLVAELTVRWRFRKQIGALVSAVVIIALSACAYHQTTFWRNADSLWPHTLAVTTNNDGAHLAFATSLSAEGKTEEAIAHARIAAEIRPANAGVYGEVPVGLEGKALDEALLFWSARVENEPNNIGARNTFGVLLVQKHQMRAAVEQWEAALALNPYDGNAQSNLAWVFATAPDASLRNGTRAVELAERALKLAGGINPILYRTLAAAYAESGRFDDAIATAERGREFAEREGNRELADEFVAVLDRYRQHQPMHDARLELHEDL